MISKIKVKFLENLVFLELLKLNEEENKTIFCLKAEKLSLFLFGSGL